MRDQRAERAATMTDAFLGLDGRLAEGESELGGLEEWIVAEAVVAARSVDDSAVGGAPRDHFALGIHIGSDTDVPGGTIRLRRDFGYQPSIVRIIEGLAAEIPLPRPTLAP